MLRYVCLDQQGNLSLFAESGKASLVRHSKKRGGTFCGSSDTFPEGGGTFRGAFQAVRAHAEASVAALTL